MISDPRSRMGANMKILVDADACPVNRIVEAIAKEKNISLIFICDKNHVIRSGFGDVVTVESGPDAVDFKIIEIGKKGDLVVTQDYGVAAMALGKGMFAVHQSGKEFTDYNIDSLLMERHLSKKARRVGRQNGKGPSKRPQHDDELFEKLFLSILNRII